MLKSCYIHIPFCKNICNYCDFCKNYYDEKLVLSYLKSLQKEIKENYNKEVLSTLYVGGGTPSALSYNALDILFKITGLFNLNDNYEFTFECNYEDITDNLLQKLKDNGVNRISIGIQTFNDKFEKTLGRKINKKEMINKINLTKKYFKNVNLDLMYALPGQTLSDLKNDIKCFINAKVTHVSTYSLMIEEHTKLHVDGVLQINDDIQYKMYKMITKMLSCNGYKHYEISNFSLPGHESKHNLTYWNNLEYYGFGAGASGFIGKIRYDNTKSIFNYIKGITRVYEENIDLVKMIKDKVMLGLRKIEGINKNDFKNRYHLELNDVFSLDEMIKNKMLIETKTNVFIPEKYLFVSNEIILNVILNCNLN